MGIFKNRLEKTDGNHILGLTGEFVSLENLTAFKDFMNKMGSDDFAYCSYPIHGFQREDYLMNRTITEIEDLDHLILVGFNPKLECPVFNARILRAVKNGLRVYKIGAAEDLTYNYEHLGTTTDVLN